MSAKFIQALILFFISFSGICQDNYTDSLLNVMKRIGEDTNRINILNQISREFEGQSDHAKAKEYALKAYNLAEKLNFKTGKAITSKILGNIFFNQGEYPKALEYQFYTLKIYEELKNEIGIAAMYTNIGNTYSLQDDDETAIEYFNKSIYKLDELKMKKSAIYLNALLGIGTAYEHLKFYDKALASYFKCKEIAEKLNDEDGIALSLNNIGNIYKDYKKEYKEALDYYLQSLKIREKIGDKYYIATSYNNIGTFYHAIKKNKEALEYSSKSLAVAKEIEAPDLAKDADLLLSEVYDDMGDKSNALRHLKAYYNMRDSLFSAENIKNIARQESQMKEEKMAAEYKEQQIKATEEKIKKEAELKQQKIISLSFTIGFILVLVLIFVVFRSLKQTTQKNKIIESQKALVELHQKEIIDSITYAKRLQQAILPGREEIEKFLPESFLFYHPKDIVAGDFYWMHTDENSVYIAAADCTGHGVPGAMVSVVCSNALNRAVKEFALTETGQILDKVRELVIETFEKSDKDVKDGMDISLMRIKKSKNQKSKEEKTEIQWSGANNSLWYIQNNELTEIKANKQPIGKYSHAVPFTTHTNTFSSTVSFYLFSDGYADQFSKNDKKLMTKKFKEILLSIQHLSMDEQGKNIEKFHIDWKGDMEQTDDVLVIGIKV